MIHLVFFSEELSMKVTLEHLLPCILPEDNSVTFQIIHHEGKSDLEQSIPRKIRAWGKMPTVEVRFVVLRDQDNADCISLKQHLLSLCSNAGRPDTLIRIVCHSLESWFLGDLSAVETAFHLRSIAKLQASRKFRDPDRLANPEQELGRLVPNYRKVSGARTITPYLNVEYNKSKSFQAFVSGVRALIWDYFQCIEVEKEDEL